MAERMKRTQIYLEPELDEELSRIAVRRGVSKAQLLREGASLVIREEQSAEEDPIMSIIGLVPSEPENVSEMHDEYLMAKRLPEGVVSEFILTGRNGKHIADWGAWTRPKKDCQWRAGRSAMELARAWFVSSKPSCPREVADLSASHPRTVGLTPVKGVPGHVMSLPQRGEGRNHDLLFLAEGEAGRAVISVEAKVDESFGETVGTYWDKGKRSATRTRAPERIEALLSMAFGATARPDAYPWCGLRYRLLTAGTAIEAAGRQASVAVVIVHEFRTESADAEKMAVSGADFQSFVCALSDPPATNVLDGRLHGPVRLAPCACLDRAVDVFIGKAVFEWEPPLGPPNQSIEPTASPAAHRQRSGSSGRQHSLGM